MDVTLFNVDVNILGILAGVVGATVLGFVVYARPVLGNIWMKEAGLTEKQMNDKEAMPAIFGTMFLMAAVVGLMLSVWVQYLQNVNDYSDLVAGLVGGFTAWLFALAALATNFMFERRSPTLLAIDAGNQLLTFVTIALIVSFIN